MVQKNNDWVVLKFGGTSVVSAENWQNIATVISQRRKEGYGVCVVHSALSGISDKIEEVIAKAAENDAHNLVEDIREHHLRLARALGLPAEELLTESFKEFEHLVKGIE